MQIFKIRLSVFIILIGLAGCFPANQLTYKMSMNPVTNPSNLEYENDTIKIAFSPTSKVIGFRIDNKINDGIKINWDEVSMSINGVAHRVIHKETGMTKTNDLQPPTTIPPHSYLIDEIVPTENVSFTYSRLLGYTSNIRDMFLINASTPKEKTKSIEKIKGSHMEVFLPYHIADKYYFKSFSFIINDVVPSIIEKPKPVSKTKSKKKAS